VKWNRPILARAATVLAGLLLTVVAVTALAGCDRHRHHRIRYDAYYTEVRPYTHRAPVVVYGGGPHCRPRPHGRHRGHRR